MTPTNMEINERDLAIRKYASARSNLMLMLVFTVVNIVLLVANADIMLLFSATVPYVAAGLAAVDESGFLLIPCLAVAALSLAGYLICWIFSKKHFGWMIAALVMFILDSLCMVGLYVLGGNIAEGILDVVIHIWVLYYLIIGVRYGAKLRKLPEEEEIAPELPEQPIDQPVDADAADDDEI